MHCSNIVIIGVHTNVGNKQSWYFFMYAYFISLKETGTHYAHYALKSLILNRLRQY